MRLSKKLENSVCTCWSSLNNYRLRFRAAWSRLKYNLLLREEQPTSEPRREIDAEKDMVLSGYHGSVRVPFHGQLRPPSSYNLDKMIHFSHCMYQKTCFKNCDNQSQQWNGFLIIAELTRSTKNVLHLLCAVALQCCPSWSPPWVRLSTGALLICFIYIFIIIYIM